MGPEEQVFVAGDVIAGRYRIEEELGRGAYGVVFRAIQLGIGRAVALKTLLPGVGEETQERQRFEREALLISRLNHPNIITLFDYGEHEGVRFMVMEYVEGQSLGELIRERGRLSPPAARRIIDQMLDALHVAHARGVVHRDLKPENIRIVAGESMDGAGVEVVKILDFGIAKIVQPVAEVPSLLDRLTESGKAMGTPQYMSPENITGDPVTHKADLYAVGLILYEMLVGQAAFAGKTPREVMVSHVRDDAPVLPDEEGFAAFGRAMAAALIKQPDDRVASARAMRVILEEDGAGRATGGGPVMVPETSSMTRALVAVALAVAVVVVLMALVVLGGGLGPGEESPASRELAVPAPGEEVAVAAPDEDLEPRPRASELVFVESVEEAAGAEEASEAVRPELPAEPRREQEEPAGLEAEPPVAVGASSKAQEAPVAPDDYHGAGRARLARPAAVEVAMQVNSVPPGARVSADGQPLGTTPLRWNVSGQETPVRLKFSMIGYRDTEVEVQPGAEDEVSVRMQRARLKLVE
ncbi:serine/threonine-protein kinase [Lujinxingia litoralis]|nr:serine/threonine-protein kinase [Lujinxingia litoralis]